MITHASLNIALYFLGKDFSLFEIRIFFKNPLRCYVELCCRFGPQYWSEGLNIYNIKSTLSDNACKLISQIVALEFVNIFLKYIARISPGVTDLEI